MSEVPTARPTATDPIALGALLTGLGALVAFVVASFTTDALWGVGLLLAAVGAVFGWVGRRRTSAGERSRTFATAGLVAVGVVLAWFVVFLIVDVLLD